MFTEYTHRFGVGVVNALLNEMGRMLISFFFLAVVVVPLALLLRWRWNIRLPRWKVPSVKLSGFVVLAWFGIYFSIPFFAQVLQLTGFFQFIYGAEFGQPVPDQELDVAQNLRQMWAAIIVMPVFLVAVISTGCVQIGHGLRDIVWGILVWVPLTLATFAVYFAVLFIMESMGVEEAKHPLTQLILAGDARDRILFVLSGSVVAPVLEEVLFRGLLVPWCLQRRYRPWIVWAFAMLSAFAASGNPNAVSRFGPLLLMVVLGVCLFGISQLREVRPRFPVRSAASIWSTAALFASFHSAVWPTPIPLFVLGLGLGWLALRTRSIVPAIVCHALFNTVSMVHLLRGATT